MGREVTLEMTTLINEKLKTCVNLADYKKQIEEVSNAAQTANATAQVLSYKFEIFKESAATDKASSEIEAV